MVATQADVLRLEKALEEDERALVRARQAATNAYEVYRKAEIARDAAAEKSNRTRRLLIKAIDEANS